VFDTYDGLAALDAPGEASVTNRPDEKVDITGSGPDKAPPSAPPPAGLPG
jgi:hypothetical protein